MGISMNSRAHIDQLFEGEGGKGCLMFPFSFRDSVRVVEWCKENIPEEDMAPEGAENETHVTVLYGFLDTVKVEQVAKLVKAFAEESGRESLALQLGTVSRFENENDVLKIGLANQYDLESLHTYLREKLGKQVECTYPEYEGHVTLAYVKKGALKELDGGAKFAGEVHTTDELIYSLPGSTAKFRIGLDGSVEPWQKVEEAISRSRIDQLFEGVSEYNDTLFHPGYIPVGFWLDPSGKLYSTRGTSHEPWACDYLGMEHNGLEASEGPAAHILFKKGWRRVVPGTDAEDCDKMGDLQVTGGPLSQTQKQELMRIAIEQQFELSDYSSRRHITLYSPEMGEA